MKGWEDISQELMEAYYDDKQNTTRLEKNTPRLSALENDNQVSLL